MNTDGCEISESRQWGRWSEGDREGRCLRFTIESLASLEFFGGRELNSAALILQYLSACSLYDGSLTRILKCLQLVQIIVSESRSGTLNEWSLPSSALAVTVTARF